MSEYKPPKEDVPVFNPRDFEYGIAGLTQSNLDNSYLNYPIAQSELRETFPAGIKVNTNVEYNNGTTQNSAFTGSSSTGAFTNADITIGANGEISAISSGTPHSEHFTPLFMNQSVSQYGTTGAGGYIGGMKIRCSGGTWGIQDYALFRITSTYTYGTDQSSYCFTSGFLQVKPYYMPSGNWSGLGTARPQMNYTNNSGTSYSGVNNAVWYRPIVQDGDLSHFSIYGANTETQLMVNSPSSSTGFTATFTLEYLFRSRNGGNVVIELGDDGTGSYLNDSLP